MAAVVVNKNLTSVRFVNVQIKIRRNNPVIRFSDGARRWHSHVQTFQQTLNPLNIDPKTKKVKNRMQILKELNKEVEVWMDEQRKIYDVVTFKRM